MTNNGQIMRDFEAWEKSIRDFSWLSEAVPGATDIDVFIERRGKFLVLETKRYVPGTGINVPFGQYLALQALSDLPEFDVWLVGEPDDGDSLYVLGLGERTPKKVRTSPVWYKARQFAKTDKAGLGIMCKSWFDEATLS